MPRSKSNEVTLATKLVRTAKRRAEESGFASTRAYLGHLVMSDARLADQARVDALLLEGLASKKRTMATTKFWSGVADRASAKAAKFGQKRRAG